MATANRFVTRIQDTDDFEGDLTWLGANVWTRQQAGVPGPGFMTFWTYRGLDDTPRVIVPGGPNGATNGFMCIYMVYANATRSDGYSVWIPPNDWQTVYTDGVNVFIVNCDVAGEVTAVRTMGAVTADVALLLFWMIA